MRMKRNSIKRISSNATCETWLKAMSFCIMAVFTLQTSADDAVRQPAFPGAEGFGRYVTGGRGGAVIYVTSLEDDKSEGTLRWACGQKGKRTIMFSVSGTIHLASPLELTEGNVTIAGQSAPGQGVCIADYPFQIKTNNVIIRYLRFRLGNKNVHVNEADGWDGLGAMDQQNIIIDHCSVSWSIDECLSIYGIKNATVQWCISSHSLNNSGHSKGSHGYGGNWGGSGITYHHNLLAHHKSRTPRLGPRYTTQLDERMDMRNNVIYNWATLGCYGGEAMKVNMVNNYYKPGPATAHQKDENQKRIVQLGCRTTEYVTQYPEYKLTEHVWGKFFIDGNQNSKYAEVAQNNWENGVYNQIDEEGNNGTFTVITKDTIRLSEPMPFIHVTTHTAVDAYNKVLQLAGCSKERDSYDELIISDTQNGEASYTGGDNYPGLIDSQEDLKPASAGMEWSAWPTLRQDKAPADTDQDGMPDEWEQANGLNPKDASDGHILASDGYTNLEHYLNSLVQDITEAGLEGGMIEGMETIAEEDAGYELSPTTKTGEESGKWIFSDGFSISTSKDYANGSGCGISGIKYSRGEKYTINIPDGIAISRFDITAYSNDDDSTAYLGELNGKTFAATDYAFPSRTDKKTASYSIIFDVPVKKALAFKPLGQQIVAVIKMYAGGTSGINSITVYTANKGKTYNIQGMEVKRAATSGIYIRNGKKFVKR